MRLAAMMGLVLEEVQQQPVATLGYYVLKYLKVVT